MVEIKTSWLLSSNSGVHSKTGEREHQSRELGVVLCGHRMFDLATNDIDSRISKESN